MFTARLCLLLMMTTIVSAQSKLIVAAAADLGPAFNDITAAFEKQHGTKVEVVLGSSGNFFAQIQNGAPYDLFFSADRDYAQKLQDRGIASGLTEYAEGAIVLWARKDAKVDVSRGMEVLKDPAVKKISVANPTHAPYGRAAINAIKHYQLTETVRDKLVLGENISQTMQFVQTGNVDVGVVALSLALSPAAKGQGRYWQIPHDAYPPIQQAAVVLRSSRHLSDAKSFLDFVRSDAGKAVLRAYGFVVPEKP